MGEETARPFKVALIIDQLTFDRLGPVVGHLCVGLLDFVTQVTLITPAKAASNLSLGPVRVALHKNLRWPFKGRELGKILEQLEQEPPSVIHAISRRSFRLGEDLAMHCERPLVRHLLSAEDLKDSSRRPTGLPEKFIAASTPLFEAAENRRGVDPECLELIRPGLLPTAEPSCFVKDDVTPTVLCMSAFENLTGVDRLVRATKILVDEGRRLMLFLLGRGPKERMVRDLVESQKLIKHVTVGRPVTDWQPAMRSADIFVVPGVVKRVDVRLLHALAAGMAAVTCEMPNSDFMIHERTGLVCNEETPQSIAAAIRRLLQDRVLARRLARAALDHCKQHHSLSLMAEETARVYRELSEQK